MRVGFGVWGQGELISSGAASGLSGGLTTERTAEELPADEPCRRP